MCDVVGSVAGSRAEFDDVIAARLVARYQAGDTESFVLLHEQYRRRVYAYLRRRTASPEDAEDLTQHVFVRVLQVLPSYRADRRPFTSWLTCVAHNAAVDHHRRNRPVSVAAPQVLVDRLDAARQQPEPALPGWGSFELDEALARVAPIHGRVLVLFYRDDLNTEEVACVAARWRPFGRSSSQLGRSGPVSQMRHTSGRVSKNQDLLRLAD
jgi:RNA polymerase sigma-70 factor (ECF subfamily)